MSALVVPLRVVPRNANGGRGHAPMPVGDWEVEFTGTLCDGAGPGCCRATVTWAFHVDGLARAYAVEVHRDGWDHPVTLSGRWRPEDCKMTRARHDAILWFLNQMMAASYGVPA